MKIENKIPRRNRLDQNCDAELAIYKAMQAVEKLPPDIRLTNAGIKLQEARSLVADFIDSPEEAKKREEQKQDWIQWKIRQGTIQSQAEDIWEHFSWATKFER